MLSPADSAWYSAQQSVSASSLAQAAGLGERLGCFSPQLLSPQRTYLGRQARAFPGGEAILLRIYKQAKNLLATTEFLDKGSIKPIGKPLIYGLSSNSSDFYHKATDRS